jgi:4-methyl-5(b-hydroxyethyl)-thiazole monophosphate biosynthesis
MTPAATREVLVPIANGTEEIEAVCIIDVLRRAGAHVTVASVDQLQITASRGVNLVADCLIEDCRERAFDLIVLPGGMPGAERLRDSQTLTEMLWRQQKAGKWYAAICAAPAVVLAHHGLLAGCRATAHPAFVGKLGNRLAAESRVVVDGHCVTSRGPGTAIEFALALVALLYDRQKADQVAGPMVMPPAGCSRVPDGRNPHG